MRCSFEETTDILYSAAANAEFENGQCVSTSIMTGQLAHFGTGSVRAFFRKTAPGGNPAAPPAPTAKRRVLRSTRRSFSTTAAAPVTEYVTDTVRRLVPPEPDAAAEDEENPTAAPVRKRARFRPSSPVLK